MRRGAVEVGGQWTSHRITRQGEGDDEQVFVVTEVWTLDERKSTRVKQPANAHRSSRVGPSSPPPPRR